MDPSDRMSMQEQLVDVIMRILVECPELHYYQVRDKYKISLLSDT